MLDPISDLQPPGGLTMATSVPFFVPLFNPLARRLMGSGIPLGPNALLTVRGRSSGLPRTTPVAVVAIAGQRWVIGTFGDVNWVRNLRAARQATVSVRRKTEQVDARELNQEQAAGFFKEVLGPYVRRTPLGAFVLGSVLGAKDIIRDPDGAAKSHPVFELRPSPTTVEPAVAESERG
jgi:deazaflavin-dependent oxidoreductase (nitroreductase family)